MCLGQKQTKLAKPIQAPEDAAPPEEIGAARAAEDELLFGGVPDLRIDRSAVGGGVGAGGTGLRKTM